MFTGNPLSVLSKFYDEEVASLPQKSKDTVARNFLLVVFFPYVMLFAKAINACRYVFRKYSRTSFSTYYLCSWTFYVSFLVQFFLMVAANWSLLKVWAQVFFILCAVLILPAWVFMRMYD